MISWMQKNNKYLVWTIWVATIAFIGAGFVGWGSYRLGSKGSSVAKVGDIEIDAERFNYTYGNLYEQYNRLFGGKFDKEQAKKMRLDLQAFNQLKNEALLLNLAKEIGITASEEEIFKEISSIKAFQSNGKFDKSIYDNYLRNIRLSKKTFEAMIADSIKIKKLMHFLQVDPYKTEVEPVELALFIKDKIAYIIIDPAQIEVDLNENEIKSYWQENKERYLTPPKAKVQILWVDVSDINVTEDEIKRHWEANGFNYTDANGKTLELEDVKDIVEDDLKLIKGKKRAQKAYIAFKKGQEKPSETVTLPLDDAKLSPEIWSEVRQSVEGHYIKPKPVGSYYAVVKVEQKIEPKPMQYEEAKERVMYELDLQKKQEKTVRLSEQYLKDFDESKANVTPFVNLKNKELPSLEGLNKQETLQFLQKVFTSKEEKGMIPISGKMVVYKVKDQKIVQSADSNTTEETALLTKEIKNTIIESNLLKMLEQRYEISTNLQGVRGE